MARSAVRAAICSVTVWSGGCASEPGPSPESVPLRPDGMPQSATPGNGAEAGADASPPPGLTACDPVAALSTSIALGAVLAAGRAPDGTLYVVDVSDGAERLFVSEGGALVRARIVGSGSADRDGLAEHSWLFERAFAEQRLFAEAENGAVKRIALALEDRGRALADYTGALLDLTVLDARDVRDLPVRNLPGEVVLEYVSHVDDGSMLVVTRPRDDWSYESFRLFWGTGTLREHALTRVSRAKDGGSTHLEFVAEGVAHDAFYPSTLARPDAPPSLTAGDRTWSLTRENTDAVSLAGAKFLCLAPR